ncbi:MAG: hypothetical protein P4M11_10675 [Candidatus Pacebacteria bacterium]|nr:hypothetical protein [Candidatus Paceibacterota bacterium]
MQFRVMENALSISPDELYQSEACKTFNSLTEMEEIDDQSIDPTTLIPLLGTICTTLASCRPDHAVNSFQIAKGFINSHRNENSAYGGRLPYHAHGGALAADRHRPADQFVLCDRSCTSDLLTLA